MDTGTCVSVCDPMASQFICTQLWYCTCRAVRRRSMPARSGHAQPSSCKQAAKHHVCRATPCLALSVCVCVCTGSRQRTWSLSSSVRNVSCLAPQTLASTTGRHKCQHPTQHPTSRLVQCCSAVRHACSRHAKACVTARPASRHRHRKKALPCASHMLPPPPIHTNTRARAHTHTTLYVPSACCTGDEACLLFDT